MQDRAVYRRRGSGKRSGVCRPHLCDSLHGDGQQLGRDAGTRKAAAKEVGSYHIDLNMDPVVSAMVALFVTVTGAPHGVDRMVLLQGWE
jgi:hypothetical protein